MNDSAITNSSDKSILAEQARMLHQQVPSSLSGGTIVAIITVIALWGEVSPAILTTCIALSLMAAGIRYYSYRRIEKNIANNQAVIRWLNETNILLFISSCIWGSLIWLMYIPDNLFSSFFLILLILALVSGSIGPLATYLPSYLFYTCPMLAIAITTLSITDSNPNLLIPIILFLFLLINLNYAKNMQKNYINNIQLRFEKADLVQQLQIKQTDLEEEHLIAVNNAKEAKEASQSKSRFLAAASHDLSQPLHSIGLFLSAMDNGETSPNNKNHLDKAQQCVENMSELFLSLLDISKLDAGAVSLESEPVDIMDLLEPIYTDFESSAKNAGLKFNYDVRSAIVVTDCHKLQRIIRNLLSNALRYTQKGHIGIKAGPTKGNLFLIEINDTGTGIDKNYFDKIFEEFYQLNNQSNDNEKGLGLGLSIVKHLAELLEIAINIESTPDVGTTFSFTLPICDLDKIADDKNEPGQKNLSNQVIVIIDDEELAREGMAAALEVTGAKLIVDESSEKVIQRLIQENLTPDFIISDYRINTHENGLNAIDRINDEFNAIIKSIIVTGDTSPEVIQSINDRGIALLRKPASATDLRNKIQLLIN